MTSKLTRERIELIANFHRAMTLPPSHDEIEELARMALAAMGSEPVAVVEPSDYVTAAQLVGEGPARKAVHELYEGALRIGDKLYRHAQTAPVVPEEKPMPNPLSMYAVDAVAAIAEAKGWNACRAAMLQHQPQNAQQNIPENIPGGLVEAVNNLLNNDGSRGCYDAMECGTAREKIELWLAQRQRWEEQRKANLYAGNSPVIPDGWVACSERLPDETQPVITVSDGGVVQRTVYQFCEGVWSDWYEQYDDVTADAFTHWMPLPAAPQEVKGE
ncbi:DUF551 domain-containing protein [Raoultella planticola]|nr:DUF551 domain-containing protein [Raoultella planticola]